MPVAIEQSRASSRGSSGSSNDGGAVNKLRSITSEETQRYIEALADLEYAEDLIVEYLDDPIDDYDYPFKDQDSVWVKTKEDKWCAGRISGKAIRVGNTRLSKQGFYYPVHFGAKGNLRKYFAPSNGEIKPDTEQVRRLLEDAGFLIN